MLKIRLKRIGKRKQPHYRFVVAESSWARDSKTVEEIGHYNPMTKPSTIVIKKERAQHWLKQGAQPTDTVAQIFVKQGLMKEIKKGSKPSQSKTKKKSKEAEQKSD
jgi:small subunit ribosomal protein S16